MPTIKEFNGSRIFIYFRDHNPPHFHIVGPDFDVAVKIDDLTALVGAVPRKAQEAVEWAEQNKVLLMKYWREMQKVD